MKTRLTALLAGVSLLASFQTPSFAGGRSGVDGTLDVTCVGPGPTYTVGCGGGGGGGGAITAAASSYSAGAFVVGTGVDGWDTTEGQKGDACAGSGSACSVDGRLSDVEAQLVLVKAQLATIITNTGNTASAAAGAIATGANVIGGVTQVAATPVTATLQSAAVANGNGTTINTTGQSALDITVNCAACSGGTTVNFEVTQDGTNYTATNGVQLGTTTIASSTAAAGVAVWEFPVGGGLTAFRARISGYSAGTVTVTGGASPVPYNAKIVKAVIDQTTPGTTNAVQAPNATLAAGTNSTVTTGGTAVTAVTPTNGCQVINPLTATDEGIGAVEPLYLNIVTTATTAANGSTVALAPGQGFLCVPGQTTAVSMNAATSGHKASVFKW